MGSLDNILYVLQKALQTQSLNTQEQFVKLISRHKRLNWIIINFILFNNDAFVNTIGLQYLLIACTLKNQQIKGELISPGLLIMLQISWGWYKIHHKWRQNLEQSFKFLFIKGTNWAVSRVRQWKLPLILQMVQDTISFLNCVRVVKNNYFW